MEKNRLQSCTWVEKTCPICGKVFIPHTDDWVYKRRTHEKVTVYFCSWGCLNKYEQQHPKKMAIDQREEIIKLIKNGLMSSLRGKIGGALIKPALKKTLKSFDSSEYGGAPLLGLNGLVVKTHGSSTAKEVKNSIIQCVTFKEQDINRKIDNKINIPEE